MLRRAVDADEFLNCGDFGLHTSKWMLAFAFLATTFLFGSAKCNAAIHEAGYVNIGGIDQWIQIRGDDTANPVLLWLNGGPGGSTIPDTAGYKSWENEFTVVMWDQRGEGKTFEKYGASLAKTMTVDQMTSDGIAMVEYLTRRLGKAKIVLLGHSWGSILGIHMIRRRPDLFFAYVGTGQVTDFKEQLAAAYPLLLERAKQLNNQDAIRELMNAGTPSSTNDEAYGYTNIWAGALDPPTHERMEPGFRPPVRADYIAEGEKFSGRLLSSEIQTANLPALGTDFQVPIFFFQGSEDLLTTTSVVRAYFDQIRAPSKAFVEIPNAGHFAIFRSSSYFLMKLVQVVRPLAVESD